MAPIPYLLYFPLTGFPSASFSVSALFPWIALVAGACLVQWLMTRQLQQDLRRQFEEQHVLRYLEAYRLLFTRHRARLRGDAPL